MTLLLNIGNAPIGNADDDASAFYQEVAGKRATAEMERQFLDLIGEPAPIKGNGGETEAEFEKAIGGQGDASSSSAPSSAAQPAAGAPAPEISGMRTGLDESGAPDAGGWTLGDLGAVLGAVGKDVGIGAAEAPRQVIGGVVDALGEVDQFMQEALPIGGMTLFDEDGNLSPDLVGPERMKELQKAEEDIFSMIAPEDAKSVTGSFVRSTAQFMTGFLPGLSVVRASGLAGASMAASSAAAGALADMVVFDPHQDRLSTFLNEVPALAGIVPDYLADTDPQNESSWEGRIKNATEGLGLGLAADGLFRMFKYYKAQKAATAKLPESLVDAQTQAAKDALADAARNELVQDIPDDAFQALGDAAAPLVVKAAPDETAETAFKRLGEARVRAEKSVENSDALAKINAVREKFAARAGATGRDPVDDMLDELRSGAVSKAKLSKRPVAAIVKGLGGIDPHSSLAGDLRSRGITAKTFPGLFNKNGVQSLDNIPAAEHQLFTERGATTPDGYIDQQSFIDALEAEGKGEAWRTAEQQQLFDDVIGPIDELDESLSRLGIDYENMSNASVKEKLQAIADEEGRLAELEAAPRIDEVPEGFEADAEIDPRVRTQEDLAAEQAAIARGDAVKNPDGTVTMKPKVYINLARINSADDVKAALQELADMDAPAIKDKTRGVVTNEQTIKESSQEFRDLNDLIGRPPGPMTAAQSVAARRLLTSSGEQIVQLARKAQAPEATKADLYNFRRAMSVHYAIQSEVVAARTETARALQAWAIPAGATKARSQAISDLIMQSGGAGDLQSLARAVTVAGDNPTGLNTIARELGRGKFGKAMYQVWINGLLSGPKTHIANILSNSMVAGWAIPERYLASGFSKAFYNGDIETGEVMAQAFGAVKGIRDGFRLMYLGNKANGRDGLSDIFDQFGKLDVEYPNAISAEAFGFSPDGGMGYGIDMLAKVVNVPGSLLQAEDKLFKSIGYRMELNALAYRQAATEGLEGRDFASRVADILNNPPDNLKADALKVADYQTFTNPLGKQGQAMQTFVQKTPGLKWIIPFMRTPTNIVKYTFERTPLAYMSGRIRADIAAGGARASQAHARVALGSLLMLTMADMSMEGVITGGGPLDPDVQKAWRDAGNMPYSIKAGGRSWQYSRTDPIGMMIGIAADITETLSNSDEEDGGKLVTAGATALASNLASKTYLSGIFEFISAIDPRNPTSDLSKWAMNQTGSLVPFSSLVRSINGANDDVLRDTKDAVVGDDAKPDAIAGFLNELVNMQKKQIPGLSDTLPARRSLWGDEIKTSSGLGWAYDMLSPIASRLDNPDAVDQVIVDNRIKVGMPQRQINGVALNAEQYSQYVELAGRPAKEALDEMVKSQGFKAMSDGPDGMKAQIVNNIINSYREAAKAQMIAADPDLREKTFIRQMNKSKTLTGQGN